MKKKKRFAAVLVAVVLAGCSKDPVVVDPGDAPQPAIVTLVVDPAVDVSRAVLLRGGFEPGRDDGGGARPAADPTLALFDNLLVPDLAEASADPSLDRYVWDVTVGLPSEGVETVLRFPTVADLPPLPELALGLREEVRPPTRWWEPGSDLILVTRPHGVADPAVRANWTVQISRLTPDGGSIALLTLTGERGFPDTLYVLGALLGSPPAGDSIVAVGSHTRSFAPIAPDSSWSGTVEVRERYRWSRVVR